MEKGRGEFINFSEFKEFLDKDKSNNNFFNFFSYDQSQHFTYVQQRENYY